MAKQIKYGKEARKALQGGAEQLSNAVVTTLGPKGRNVAIDKKWGPPTVIHDGVSVAKEIELEDPFENMGAQLIKEAASKTNDKAGDGTTTATLLAYKLVEEGIKLLDQGTNPMILKKGIDIATDFIIKELKGSSQPVNTPEKIEQVATISSANPEVGKMINKIIKKIGTEGTISVEDGSGMSLEDEYKEGMQFDKGYISPHFITDIEKMEAELDDPVILLTTEKISSPGDFIKLFQEILKITKNIVVIAEDFDGEAFPTFVINKNRGVFNPLPIKAPAFADRKKDILEDIAILTGATVISKEAGRTLENTTINDLGHADRVWADADSTKIIGGRGDKDKIKARIEQIKNLIEKETSDFEKEKLKERLAKLASGVAVIKVGAATETEMKERKERVIDAVEATKSAIAEGIVAGGGIALYNISKKIERLKNENTEIQQGIDLVKKAIQSPIYQILENAGEQTTDIISQIGDMVSYGYNVETQEFGDMFKMGVVDPTKVTRLAIQNATSVASMILTTECLVTDIPEKDDPREKII